MLVTATIFITMAGPQALAQTAKGTVFNDENRNGQRDPGEKGLPSVGVSNQHQVVLTDEDGAWELPVDDDTSFFVIKPRNWMTPVDIEFKLPRFYYTHKPNGSPALRYPGVKPTGPLPDSIDFPLHRRPEPDVFRTLFFGDTQCSNEQELQYMAHDVIAELVGFDGAFGVTLGDIVNNSLSLFDQHNRTVALVGMPWYNVIGNHDINFDADDDKRSDETFERVFGPAYYSFDHGPTHFIVMDNIHWHAKTETKNGHYTGNFGPEQLAFVKNDLAHVPNDKLIMLMMHIPLTGTDDREGLYRLIEDRPYSLSISGHTHWQAHQFIGTDAGWNGRTPHHHVINVTVCGSWWQGAPDELGIPHTLMRDGAPNGYSIITFDGHSASIEYKAARQPATYQMNIFAPYTVKADQAADTEVLINVFGGSEKSIVEMRLGDDGDWIPMTRTPRQDPAVLAIRAAQDSKNPPRGTKLGAPIESAHIWAAKLPKNPTKGLQILHARTTDMYGKTFTAGRAIHIR
jgi:hypothetical protein